MYNLPFLSYPISMSTIDRVRTSRIRATYIAYLKGKNTLLESFISKKADESELILEFLSKPMVIQLKDELINLHEIHNKSILKHPCLTPDFT